MHDTRRVGEDGSKASAAQPQVKDSNEAINMDFTIIPDLDKNLHVALVLADTASDLTVVIYTCPGSTPTAE